MKTTESVGEVLRVVTCPGCEMEFADSELHDANLCNWKLTRVINAIQARISGEFDHPDLVFFGPLGHVQEDITRFIRSLR